MKLSRGKIQVLLRFICESMGKRLVTPSVPSDMNRNNANNY